MVELNIEVGNPIVDREFIKLVLKSFKMSTETNLDKVAHQLVGCPKSNLLELLNTEDNNPEGPTEENLPKLIKCIITKDKNIRY